jgi:hypothetical protein
MARDHRRGRQDMMNAVLSQDLRPLRFGGEAWFRSLQSRRSKINYENISFVDCHRNSYGRGNKVHCHRNSKLNNKRRLVRETGFRILTMSEVWKWVVQRFDGSGIYVHCHRNSNNMFF